MIADHLAKSTQARESPTQFPMTSRRSPKGAKNSFTIPGVGKLVLVTARRAWAATRPREKVKIPAKRVVKFRVSKKAKDATWDQEVRPESDRGWRERPFGPLFHWFHGVRSANLLTSASTAAVAVLRT